MEWCEWRGSLWNIGGQVCGLHGQGIWTLISWKVKRSRAKISLKKWFGAGNNSWGLLGILHTIKTILRYIQYRDVYLHFLFAGTHAVTMAIPGCVSGVTSHVACRTLYSTRNWMRINGVQELSEPLYYLSGF